MKKIYYTLIGALTILLMSGCLRQDNGPSASQKVQNLIDEAYEMLISSEEGWYFDMYQGWNKDMELGSYWYVCRFTDDNQVQVSFELDVTKEYNRLGKNPIDPVVIEFPVGETYTSDFEVIRGEGAVLTFNSYNPILQFFVEPDGTKYEGYEGDLNFRIEEVTYDYIKVKGNRSRKYMYLYRKTDGKSLEQAAKDLSEIGNRIDRTKEFTVEVNGAYMDDAALRPTASRGIMGITESGFRPIRAITLTYSEDTGEIVIENNVDIPVIVNHEVKMLYQTNLDGSGITLYEPVEIFGNEITGFNYDRISQTFTSNDANETVKLGQPIAQWTLEDVLGTYRVKVTGSWIDDTIFNVTIQQKEGNSLRITGFGFPDVSFDAVFYADYSALLVPNGRRIEGITLSDGGYMYMAAFGTADPIEFIITDAALWQAVPFVKLTKGAHVRVSKRRVYLNGHVVNKFNSKLR